jgi:putative ABC transport system permease protein
VLTLVLRSVRHNLGRYVATLVAIMTGVAFYAATGLLSDRVIDTLEGDVDRQYGSVDVAVVPDESAVEDSSGLGGAATAKLTVSGGSADRILALEGVEAGGGTLTGQVAFLGEDGKPFAKDATGRLWIADDALNPLSVADGEAPQEVGEIAVDRGLAEQYDLSPGDRVTVLTLAGKEPATITGTTRFGESDNLDGSSTVSIPEASAFDWLNDGQVEYDDYYVRGSASQSDLLAEVETVVPQGFEAVSGDDYRQDKRDESGAVGQALKQALQAFAVLALLVGGFVIYNTFSVIVAQRLRELAVLSAIGATGRQLKRSLRTEGLVIGLLGSALGVVAGFGLVFALDVVLRLLDVELPGSGISVSAGNVVGALVLGTVITVASVMIPARRAARTEPIEALRDAAVERNPLSRRRGTVAAVLTGVGLLGMLGGPNVFTIGGGMVLFVAGVVVGGPFLAVGAARAIRPAMERVGMEGRLAVDNTIRSPKRTATTANALLIGVFLVTLVAVSGTSMRDFAVGEINKLQSADYVVTSQGGTLDDAFVRRLEDVDGVSTVSPFRRDAVTVDGKPFVLSSGDVPTLVEIADLEADRGTIEDLGPGEIAVLDTDGGPALGEVVAVEDNRGRKVDLMVAGLIAPSIDSVQVGALAGEPTFDRLVGDVAPTVAFVDIESGAESGTKDDIEALADQRPDITVTQGNALGRTIGSIFDFLIKAVTGLLLMSVVIALIGIVNTMSLSILERRRELGLLRIIGMTDRRVQRMVRLESVLIAMLGTVSGIVAGLAVSLALVLSVNRLTPATVDPSFPVLELVGVLVAGVVLGVLAALVPARRSTRLEVLDAVKAT